MNWIKTLTHLLSGTMLIAISLYQIEDSYGIESHTELTVSTRCDPHSDIVNPSEVKIQMAFSSTAAGPVATARMNMTGPSSYEATSTSPHWEVPSKGWVSFTFEGPPLSAHYYCQTDWGNKSLHLAYQASPNIHLSLGRSDTSPGIEIDTQPTDVRSTLTLTPDINQAVYAAGHGSNNPFWLQVAIPVYNTGTASTVLRNDFL